MVAHESLGSYYTNNFHALFHKDIGFTNKFTLSDFEGMLPYEREIYMSMMMQKVEEYSKK
jgi:hypothetical protein